MHAMSHLSISYLFLPLFFFAPKLPSCLPPSKLRRGNVLPPPSSVFPPSLSARESTIFNFFSPSVSMIIKSFPLPSVRNKATTINAVAKRNLEFSQQHDHRELISPEQKGQKNLNAFPWHHSFYFLVSIFKLELFNQGPWHTIDLVFASPVWALAHPWPLPRPTPWPTVSWASASPWTGRRPLSRSCWRSPPARGAPRQTRGRTSQPGQTLREKESKTVLKFQLSTVKKEGNGIASTVKAETIGLEARTLIRPSFRDTLFFLFQSPDRERKKKKSGNEPKRSCHRQEE